MNVTFTLDPCTTNQNRLGIEKIFTEEDNGLSQSWGHECVFMNPPYSRGNIDLWTNKARYESLIYEDTVVVGLLPLRTAKWFRRNILPGFKILRELHDWIHLKPEQCGVFFLEKRVKFIDPEKNAPIPGSPNFDSFLAIWV
jgi:hypothetical protein